VTPRSARQSSSDAEADTEAAARLWTALQEFVAAHDRRRQMQDELGLGRGLGRVRLLVQLTGGPRTLREIAEANGYDAPYTTVVIDKLAARGLVERTAHPDNKRAKLVALTAEGRRAAARARQIMDAPPAALLALDPADLAVLGDLVARLAPNVTGSRG
jgi:DNA-binding MarR family transcriptional regulator